MKKTSAFRNPKALIGGLIIGIAVMAGTVGVFAVRGPTYAESRPGSVMVRPIVKDDSVKRLTTAFLLGLIGFYYGTRMIGRRIARNEENKPEA